MSQAYMVQLFAECKHDSTSRLCVDDPNEIVVIVMLIGTALVIKGCLTIITFGIKLPGKLIPNPTLLNTRLRYLEKLTSLAGIFIPSLVVGACFGRIAGLAMEWIEHSHPNLPIFDVCRGTECVVPGLYAMVSFVCMTLPVVSRQAS
jgi:chloride channel 3/4/5